VRHLGQCPLNPTDKPSVKDQIVVEALMRLPDVDVNADAELKQTALRYVASLGDDPKKIEIIRKLKLKGLSDQLLAQAVAWGMSTQAVQAVELVAQQDGLDVAQEASCATRHQPRRRLLWRESLLSATNASFCKCRRRF
jgi:hypothetical protein